MVSILAVIEPLIVPATRALSATTIPVTSLPSPWISAAQLMSPATFPSRCRSAVAFRSPSMAISGLRTEKVDPAIGLLADRRAADSGFFENIGRDLQKWAGIDGLAVQANLEMQMRSGRPAGASNGADDLARADRIAGAGAERGHVRVTRAQSVAMVDLDELPVTRVAADEGDAPAGGGQDRRPARRFEIQA